MYAYQDEIINTIPTTVSDDKYVTIVGHNLESGDVVYNVDTSDIQRVVYISGDNVYNATTYPSDITGGIIGVSNSSQNAGDVIRTFKFQPYSITNHWEAVANGSNDKSSKYSYIQSNTTNDIDSFDMEELVADKSVDSGVQINAVSLSVYAKEAGAGSQFQHLVRTNSTDYVGDTKTMSGGTLDYQHIWSVNPDTSARWTQAQIDAIETGVKVVS